MELRPDIIGLRQICLSYDSYHEQTIIYTVIDDQQFSQRTPKSVLVIPSETKIRQFLL